MKVVALVSGGKDSCYAMMKSIHYGHQIVALANLMPVDDSVDELDSYMYQTVGHQIITSYAECMGLPLFRRRIQGSSRHLELGYKTTQGDEVEDMYILLREVKRQIPSVTAVCSGAIASDYQRLRVESVCSRLGLVSLAYLWKQDQSLLLQEMIANGIEAITVKVAAMGLVPAKHLGKEIAILNAYLHKLKESYGINVCGEGGEYETLTLDCPLFINARIVLDEYQVVMHSSDSIAPVGILHPLAFHLENKEDIQFLNTQDKIHEICVQKLGSVLEVDDGQEKFEATCKPVGCADPIDDIEHKFNISRTNNKSTFSICCWLQDSCNDLQEDLKIVLRKIESQLASFGFGWENVLYIHLYIDDMNKFSEANETYVKFITQDKCPFGVPSRSTVEMPLIEMGFSRAYIEVLVANNKDKKVLHVQSISCWAPSCIGPYSQATLHEGILHMAGQLGLDPPTMNLCSGGPGVELEQALKNSEAVAKSFNCSISTSAIGFVIYCSKNTSSLERLDIEKKQETILRQMKISDLEEGKTYKTIDPIFLYVLVSDLPKRAFVEVKPIVYVEDGADIEIATITERSSSKTSCYWGFKQESWHDDCIQKCVIPGKICAIILSITSELAAKICYNSMPADYGNNNAQHIIPKAQMEQLSKFCIYLLDKVITDNDFAWEDVMSLRFYVPVSLQMSVELLQPMFSNALIELSEMSQRKVKNFEEPIFNIVPVVGAGRAASSMDDVVTCELLARKS
ncbi:diphthine--ammonia ligase isoform X2 [Cicer arietinum]|uniref:Diphthine--ammonia ligase n=1 Tax=Cicer arietinum TaxID=3827 RepID=A0A1S2XR39_CICAR|nr:diphthine--ammonia ligase [Cicer arietinum]XP_004493206.1 diphthine--ammonia ligase [Cicer arietinum]XP_012569239.1 diphthine--ammonia ligase [Cicer arietinum]